MQDPQPSPSRKRCADGMLNDSPVHAESTIQPVLKRQRTMVPRFISRVLHACSGAVKTAFGGTHELQLQHESASSTTSMRMHEAAGDASTHDTVPEADLQVSRQHVHVSMTVLIGMVS